MDAITITQLALVIPFEKAIALYRLGLIDGAFLANFLPVTLLQAQCPEILEDSEAIAKMSQTLANL